MLTCRLVACAETIIRDAAQNTVSLINVLEDIQVPAFPGGIFKITVLGMVNRAQNDPAEYDFVIVITLGDDELGRVPVHADFTDKVSSRIIAVLQGIPLPQPGVLRVALRHNETELGAWSVTVTQRGPLVAEVVAQ